MDERTRRGGFTDGARMVAAARLDDDALPPSPLNPEQVVAGSPEVRHLTVVEAGDLAIGIWQHGPGLSRDVEVDEAFVVLTGSATIDVEGGPILEVAAGDLVLLPAGAATVWNVHETLRKVYVSRATG
jgi:uncharacterized cupin superfamily protein